MTSDSPITCDECGALVAQEDRHRDWHEQLVTRQQLEAFGRKQVEDQHTREFLAGG